MDIFSEKSIIIKKYSLHDLDEIVVLFTEKHGIVRGVVKRSRGKKSTFSGRVEIFSEVLATINFKGYENLSVIKDLKTLNYFRMDRGGIENYFLLSFFGELLLNSRFEKGNFNVKLFSLFEKVLLLPKLNKFEKLKMATYVLFWVMELEGLLPSFKRCSVCGRDVRGKIFVDRNMVVLCENCINNKVLELSELEDFLKLSPFEFLERKFKPKKIENLFELLLYKFQDFLKLKLSTKNLIL